MKTGVEKLTACLSGMVQYSTPLFQRPFTWEKQNWERLWDDLLGYYDDPDGANATHFMGAIVVQRKAKIGAIAPYWTIDGQQRLTTISILLCVLRDLADQNKDIGEEVRAYLTNESKKDAPALYLKLALGEHDRDAYQAVALQKERKPDSENSKIVQCYRFFRKVLEKAERDDEMDIQRFYEIVRDVPEVVLIDLDENDDPYLIFESLNFKGAPLKSVDLIRNFILMKFKAEEEQERVYHDFWKPLENMLGDSAEDFFFHYVRKETKSTTAKTRVYEEIKKIFGSLDADSAKKKLSRLLTNAKRYQEFLRPETLSSQEVADEFIALKSLQCQVVYPFLLQLRELYEDGEENGEYVRTLRVLNSFILRRAICGGQSVMGSGFAATLVRALETIERPFDRRLEELLLNQKGKSFWPNDEMFCDAVKKCGESTYRSELTKYFLGTIERKLAGKEAGDVANATVEHIMPQTLNVDWEDALGPNFESIRSAYLNSFGNLTLTKSNSELGNQSFAKKRENYQNSCFFLNREIAKKNCWTPKEIEARADFLARQAIEIWRYPRNFANAASLTLWDDWTYQKPRRVVWNERNATVKTFLDAYRQTLVWILEQSSEEKFWRVVGSTKGLQSYFRERANDGLREELKVNDRLFAEKNLSAESKRRIIFALFDKLQLSPNGWKLDL